MSYSDEWLKAVNAARQRPKPVEPTNAGFTIASTTWKPWAKMTAEERRKALAQRDGK